MSNLQPLKINLTLRDGAQSNLGTKMSAAEFVAAFPNAKNYGVHSIQTGGGTFWNEFIRTGRDPEAAVRTIGAHFKESGVPLTALYRGEFGLSTQRLSLDVHRHTLNVLAESGITVLQNFHGMNDPKMMAFLPKLAAEYGMTVQGGICVQVNPDMQKSPERMQQVLEEQFQFAGEILKSGHKGFYVKSASGVLTPEFTYALIKGLKERYPDQEITLHTHDTYGVAAQNIIAGVKAGLDAVDVLPPAFAGGTAQISFMHLAYFMKHSGDPEVMARLPQGVNLAAMQQDAASMLMLRGTYRGNEMKYDPHALELAQAASSAGGAIGVIKGMPGIRKALSEALKTDDWDTMRDALYRMKAEVVRPALGYPTNVTPYELMLDLQSMQSVLSVSKGKPPMDFLHPMTIKYLTGEWGRVSSTVDKDLQNRALEMMNLGTPANLQPIEYSQPVMETARVFLLRNIGDKKPNFSPITDSEAHAFVMCGGLWADNNDPVRKLIEGTRKGTIKPNPTPELPDMLKDGKRLHSAAPLMFELVYTALEIQKLNDGFYRGVEGVDSLIVKLESRVREIMNDEMGFVLKADGGLEKQSLGRALQSVNPQLANLCREAGVRTEFIPQITLDFSHKTSNDLIELLGLDQAAATIESLWHQGEREFQGIVDDVEAAARRHGLLPYQIEHSLEILWRDAKGRISSALSSETAEDRPEPRM